ncbi:30S ribosomal protein S9 [Saprospiraceae bacterium]|nr:30S ribosomal protein S9 [Saprospiraceae bacterium]
MEYINAIGRRKASVARVYMSNGDGQIEVNGKEYRDYFPQPNISAKLMEPFETVELTGKYNLKVKVNGGGFKGQAEAIRMAIARALVTVSEDYRKALKDRKFLMRDARVVERKKYGKPKARKSFQFSKR